MKFSIQNSHPTGRLARSGFSIIELCISIGLLAIIALIAYMLISRTIKTTDSTNASRTFKRETNVILNYADFLIRRADIRGWSNFPKRWSTSLDIMVAGPAESDYIPASIKSVCVPKKAGIKSSKTTIDNYLKSKRRAGKVTKGLCLEKIDCSEKEVSAVSLVFESPDGQRLNKLFPSDNIDRPGLILAHSAVCMKYDEDRDFLEIVVESLVENSRMKPVAGQTPIINYKIISVEKWIVKDNPVFLQQF